MVVTPIKMFGVTLVLLFIIRLRFPTSRSIADVISKRYSQEILRLVRRFESADLKHKKCELDIGFLDKCIKHELFPTFVRFKVANSQLRGSKVHRDCQLRLLKQELSNKKRKLTVLKKRLDHLKAEVSVSVSWIDFVHVSNCFLKHNDKVLIKTRLVHEKKLVQLGLQSTTETNNPEKVIFNYSSRILNNAEKLLLSKGLNLSIPPKKLNYADTLAPFEMLFREIDESNQEFADGDKQAFQAGLKNCAFQFSNNYDPKAAQNLTPEEVQALKSLMQDDSYHHTEK